MVIEGKLHVKFETQQVTDTFRKRDFVVEYSDNPLYPQYIQFQTIQDRCTLIDNLEEGEKIEVTFNLRGREWTAPSGEKKYFNTLEAWRVQKVESAGNPPAVAASVVDMSNLASDEADDLPF
jgi:translation initiation factor IF-3